MQFLLTSHGAAASPSYPPSACMGKTVQAQARLAGLIHVNPCRDNDGKLRGGAGVRTLVSNERQRSSTTGGGEFEAP